MTMFYERFVGRIFDVVDIDEATLSILNHLRNETGYASQQIRDSSLTGDDAETARVKWHNVAGERIGSAWIGNDGRWRLGIRYGDGALSSKVGFVDDEWLADWKDRQGYYMAQHERIARAFCDTLPPEVADHPKLGGFSHCTVVRVRENELLVVGEMPGGETVRQSRSNREKYTITVESMKEMLVFSSTE